MVEGMLLELLCLFVLLGQGGQFSGQVEAASQLPVVLDEREVGSIEQVAKVVCESAAGDKRQISRISTIVKLADYLESAEESNELIGCKANHLEAIKRLREVATVSVENVCSDEKVSLIEDFHADYLSTHPADAKARKESDRKSLPHLLELFFLHFAREVSAICQKNLINNLEWDLKEHFGPDEQLSLINTNGLNQLMSGLFEKFSSMYSVNNFDDVILIWDLIEGSYLAKESTELSDFGTDEITGQKIKMLAKARDTSMLQQFKDRCRSKLRPIYEKLILPIIRLANLGYSDQSSRFARELDELKSNELVRRWYGATQFCEAIGPIRFYSDPEMQAGQIEIISYEDAAKLTGNVVEQTVETLKYEPTTNSMLGVDQLMSVFELEDQQLVQAIRLNLSARERTAGRAVVKILRDMKHQFKNYVGKVFYSAKRSLGRAEVEAQKSAGGEREDAGKLLGQLSEQDLLKLEGGGKKDAYTGGIRRRKGRRRKGDEDIAKELRGQELTFQHTKSWGEIFEGWQKTLSVIAPSRVQMIIVGGIGVLILLSIVIATIAAG